MSAARRTDHPANWRELSSQPNSREALAFRRTRLDVPHEHVDHRNDFLRSVSTGRRLLDVGCGGQLASAPAKASLHEVLSQVASSAVGVDSQEASLDVLRSRGADVEVADVTVDDPPVRSEPFEVVVAADVIEHIPDLLSLFTFATKALGPEGRLVITTPNPYAPWRVAAARRNLVWENVDHVCYLFPSGMVELADRSGYRLVKTAETRAPRRATDASVSLRTMLSHWRAHVRHRVTRKTGPAPALPARWQHPLDIIRQRSDSSAWLGETAIYVFEKAR